MLRHIIRTLTTRPHPIQPNQRIHINESTSSERLNQLINKQIWNNNGHITLPAHMFTINEYHTLECHHYLRHRYLFATLASSIVTNGAYITLDIGNTSVIVIRGPDATIRAMLNNCSHMNARLCARSNEVYIIDKIRCPLHHWTFATSGELIAPRTAITRTEEQRRQYALKHVDMIHSRGFVFVKPSHNDALNENVDILSCWPDDLDLHQYRLVLKKNEMVTADWKLMCSHEYDDNMTSYHSLVIGPSLSATIDHDKAYVVIQQCLPTSAGNTSVTRYHLVKSSAKTDDITANSQVNLFDECTSRYEREKQRAEMIQQQLSTKAANEPISISSMLSDLVPMLQVGLVKDIERDAAFRIEQDRQWAMMNKQSDSS